MLPQQQMKETKTMPNPQDDTSISNAGETHTRLHGQALPLARALWVIMSILMLGNFFATLPIRYRSHFNESFAVPRRWINLYINHSANIKHDIQGIEADFTPPLEELGPLTADLIYAGRGCESDLPYRVDIRNKIVLLDRGGCIFLEKVQDAEEAGAVAVLIAHDQTGPLGTMLAYSRAKIPAVEITKLDGDTLRELLAKEKANVTVSFAHAVPSAVAELGISREVYAGYRLALNIAVLLGATLMSLIIFWRRSEDWMALLVAFALVAVAAIPISSWSPWPSGFLFALHPMGKFIVEFLAIIADLSIFSVLFLLFPNGRFVPRWLWIIAILSVPWVIIRYIYYSTLGGIGGPFQLAPFLIILGFYSTGIFAQVYRYRYVSSPVQREQTKWIVFGLAVAVLGNYAEDIGLLIFPSLDWLSPSGVIYDLVTSTLRALSLILAVVTFAIAVLRYKLWDIDIIINRTLVYGALTASVIGIYVVVVGTLGTTIQGRGNLLISILATGLVAVLVQPLRDRLQRGVNHMMYGERDDPITVLSRLGQRLEGTLAPDAVLPSFLETVAKTLKLPYVAIETADQRLDSPPTTDSESNNGSAPTVAYGNLTGEVIRFPLIYQSETIGQLIVAPRGPGEALSPMDRHLLENIAHQAGMAVHAVSLTADLQRSRQRLVTTREEERRRLRRDLHDGLGPNLASQGLKLAAVKQLLEKDPGSAIPLLDQVMAQNKSTVEDVRRLVYGLRPPALDELGLVAAIRDYLAGMNGKSALQIEITEPPGDLPLLSAAVEVAAYRIVLEALTNVIRHAQAKRCIIRFSIDQKNSSHALQVEIQDDGIGLPSTHRAGVGTRAMQERAEELGGRLTIESASNGGTRVCMQVPLIMV